MLTLFKKRVKQALCIKITTSSWRTYLTPILQPGSIYECRGSRCSADSRRSYMEKSSSLIYPMTATTTFIQAFWLQACGWWKDDCLKGKYCLLGKWRRDSQVSFLHWDELRAHREDHPLQQSWAACSRMRREEEREKRGERLEKQAFTAPSSTSSAGAKIWDWSLDPRISALLSFYPNKWRLMETMGGQTKEMNRPR